MLWVASLGAISIPLAPYCRGRGMLTPMVAHGRLRLRYPDKPNRADQAYTADDLVKEDDVSLTEHADK